MSCIDLCNIFLLFFSLSSTDEVYVSDLVKYGELNDSKSNDEKDLLTSQEILDARALISANGSLFEDELSHVKGVTNDDTTSINQDGMFGTLLNEHNSRVNEREQIEASPWNNSRHSHKASYIIHIHPLTFD